jgi:two-component system, sensor histidine kinase PhcS
VTIVLTNDLLPASFDEAEHRHLIFYSRITCLVAMVLVAGGVGLDAAFYPDRMVEFGLARLLVVALIGLTLMSYRAPWGSQQVRRLTYFWIALPQLMIAWMIFSTEGEASIYFVGYTFAVSGICIFLPLSVAEAVGFSAFTIAAHVAACSLRADGVQNWPALAGQLVFIAFYALIAITVSVYGGRQRRQTYVLQTEVQRQKDELLEQNKALAEIKGQLLQREKMAALGTLSAGLLHELNNPVNYSLMAINMAQQLPPVKTDELLAESLADAKEGMTRVQNIVTDLKTFAYQKPGDNSLRPFLLEQAIRSAQRLAGHELKGVQVTVEQPQDTHVLGDEPAIIGVLINLFSNAALALQRAGREQPRIDVRVTETGDRLRVSVRDNGQGILPEHIGRVFEPFFTTRDVGAGLGLGLSMSYGIVQRHGGVLAVESEHGAWTEFTFDLPRPAA